MGGQYGMGNRRNGSGRCSGDSRCSLHHHEKVNLFVSDKLGAKQIRFSPV